ncbi:MAG TPA: CBS domain-containing protein [Candidatus Nanoarchaeia archaeon]|nr:CBS domain-containing protein [Candidatus Nanoarchaeia archaeon]
MKVSELMKKAIVVDGNISAKEAARIMSEKAIGSLIVIKNERIAGIITERDILKNIDKLGSKLSQIMSKNVITISPKQSVDEAASTMAENKIKRLPVVEHNEILGIITATDILAHSDALNEDFMVE